MENVKKIKINEEYRKLFPELAESLETKGQLEPVKVTEDGEIKDGMKRVLLCGLENLDKVTVPKDYPTSVGLLTREQRNVVLRNLHQNLLNKYGSSEIVDMLSKRYGLSRRQVYRILFPECSDKMSQHKPRMSKCLKCEKLYDLQQENEKLKAQLEGKRLSQDFLEKAIQEFLNTHPYKKFNNELKVFQDE